MFRYLSANFTATTGVGWYEFSFWGSSMSRTELLIMTASKEDPGPEGIGTERLWQERGLAFAMAAECFRLRYPALPSAKPRDLDLLRIPVAGLLRGIAGKTADGSLTAPEEAPYADRLSIAEGCV